MDLLDLYLIDWSDRWSCEAELDLWPFMSSFLILSSPDYRMCFCIWFGVNASLVTMSAWFLFRNTHTHTSVRHDNSFHVCFCPDTENSHNYFRDYYFSEFPVVCFLFYSVIDHTFSPPLHPLWLSDCVQLLLLISSIFCHLCVIVSSLWVCYCRSVLS